MNRAFLTAIAVFVTTLPSWAREVIECAEDQFSVILSVRKAQATIGGPVLNDRAWVAHATNHVYGEADIYQWKNGWSQSHLILSKTMKSSRRKSELVISANMLSRRGPVDVYLSFENPETGARQAPKLTRCEIRGATE